MVYKIYLFKITFLIQKKMTKLSMLHGQVFIDVGHMSLFVGILEGFDISIFCNSQELISAWHRLGLSAESFLLYTVHLQKRPI